MAPTTQLRQKDAPGVPVQKGTTGGSFAGHVHDQAPQLTLTNANLAANPGLLHTLKDEANAARKRLDIASAKVIYAEIKKIFPDAESVRLTRIERDRGEFAGWYPRSIHRRDGAQLAEFIDYGSVVRIDDDQEYDVTPEFSEAVDNIPKLPQYVLGEETESGSFEVTFDPDYAWHQPAGSGDVAIHFDDLVNVIIR